MAHMGKQKIVIVGGGFGGIKAALELSGSAQANTFDITLISKQPNFQYYPALYRTATGGSVAGSSIPLQDILSETGVKVVIDEATVLDRKAKSLTLASGKTVNYGTLVMGLGVVTNYFGIPGMEEFSLASSRLKQFNVSNNIFMNKSTTSGDRILIL